VTRVHDDQAAIEVDGLTKTYRTHKGAVRALDGISFTVAPGTVFGLLGPNGAGKSTVVRILTTLSRPDAGRARVAGEDVVARPDRVRRGIGAVSQATSVDPEATGRENLALQGRLYGLAGTTLRRRVGDLLDRFGLAGPADRPARTWSGGMQRKLDVAMGLVHQPKVLFLDEPTTGLDPEARAELWRQITQLGADEGLTVLLTTHYLEEADRLAADLAIIDHGRVVAAGSPERLKADLHGDAIHVRLADAPSGPLASLVGQALAAVAGVGEVRLAGSTVHARAGRGAAAVPAVLAALEAAGLAVAEVAIARPSLDDVYLRHTGHAFAEADPVAGARQLEEARS
jgi:ABC-2 type transport system ATP-binding protein